MRGPVLDPPCNRHRRLPRIAGARQGFPLLLERAPHLGAVDGSPEGLPLSKRPRPAFTALPRPKKPPHRGQALARGSPVLSRPAAHRGLTLLERGRPHGPLSRPRLERLPGIAAVNPARAPAALEARGGPRPRGRAPVKTATAPPPHGPRPAETPLSRAGAAARGSHGVDPRRRVGAGNSLHQQGAENPLAGERLTVAHGRAFPGSSQGPKISRTVASLQSSPGWSKSRGSWDGLFPPPGEAREQGTPLGTDCSVPSPLRERSDVFRNTCSVMSAASRGARSGRPRPGRGS